MPCNRCVYYQLLFIFMAEAWSYVMAFHFFRFLRRPFSNFRQADLSSDVGIILITSIACIIIETCFAPDYDDYCSVDWDYSYACSTYQGTSVATSTMKDERGLSLVRFFLLLIIFTYLVFYIVQLIALGLLFRGLAKSMNSRRVAAINSIIILVGDIVNHMTWVGIMLGYGRISSISLLHISTYEVVNGIAGWVLIHPKLWPLWATFRVEDDDGVNNVRIV